MLEMLIMLYLKSYLSNKLFDTLELVITKKPNEDTDINRLFPDLDHKTSISFFYAEIEPEFPFTVWVGDTENILRFNSLDELLLMLEQIKNLSDSYHVNLLFKPFNRPTAN
jgi:hypothetical protein